MEAPHETKRERRRATGRILVFGATVGLVVGLLATSASAATAVLKPEHIGSTNPGFQTDSCPANPFGSADWGWHFILSGGSDFVSISIQFQNEGTVTQMVNDPNTQHAYVFTSGPDTILGGTAEVTGPDTEFVLSHVCTGTTSGGSDPGGGEVSVGGASASAPAAPAAPAAAAPRTAG